MPNMATTESSNTTLSNEEKRAELLEMRAWLEYVNEYFEQEKKLNPFEQVKIYFDNEEKHEQMALKF